MQEGRPISFESHPIKGKYLYKSIYEKEMLEILHALKKWRPYLVKVKTYHDSLKYFWDKDCLQKRKKKMGHRDVGL